MKKRLTFSFALFLTVFLLNMSWAEYDLTRGDKLSVEADVLYADATTKGKRKKALEKYLEAVEAYKEEENFADTSRNLSLVGNIYAEIGEFKKAIEAYQSAMDFAEKAETKELFMHALLNEGIVYLNLGNPDRAMEAFTNVVDYFKEEDQLEACRTIIAIGRVHEIRGDIDEAAKSYNEALKTARRIEDMDIQANALNRIARVALYRGNHDKAFYLWDVAVKLAWESAKEEPRKLPEVGKILGTRGKGYLALGQSLKAMEQFQLAVAGYRKAGMPRHEAAALEDLAEAGFMSERIGTGISSFLKAMEIKGEIGVPAGSVYAKAANFYMDYSFLKGAKHYVENTDNLLVQARYNVWNGDLDAALELYVAALADAEKRGAELDRFAAYTGIGVVYERMGDRINCPEADAVIQEMDQIPILDVAKFNKEGLQDNWIAIYTRYMLAYKNLTESLAKVELSDESTERLKPYKAAYEHGNSEIKKMAPASWKTKSRIPHDALSAMIEPLHSAALQAQDLLMEQKLTGHERREYGKFYDAIWEAWRHYNQIVFSKEELELLRRAAALKVESPEKSGATPNEAAMAYYHKAADYYSKGVALTEIVRERLDSEDKGRFLNLRISGFRRTAAYEGYARVMVKTGKPKTAFKLSDFTKARSFSESLERRKLGQAMKIPADVIDYEAKLTATLEARRKNRMLGFSIGQSYDVINRYDKEIRKLENDLDVCRKRTAEKFPAFAALTFPKAMDISDSALRYEEWSVAYDVTDLGTIIYLLKGRRILSASILPVPRSWMNRMVAAIREPPESLVCCSLYGNTGVDKVDLWISYMNRHNWNINDLPKTLGNMLLEKAVEQVPDGERLLIIPDESLYTLPFQALRLDVRANAKSLDSNSTEFVQDRIAVYYYPSVRALTDLRNRGTRRAQAPTRTLILADHRESWSVEEADYLRKLDPQSTDCYVGIPRADFLFKKDLRPYRYIIFVEHGLGGTALSQASVYLSLKGKDGPSSEVIYQTHEFMQMSLNADLVSFHACQTGIGEELAGEVMMSLGTAALYAGADSAIMTLWVTDGNYIRKWREYFFPALYEGEPKLDALWKSHNLFWDDIEDKEDLAGWRCPKYWAPFVLIGEPD